LSEVDEEILLNELTALEKAEADTFTSLLPAVPSQPLPILEQKERRLSTKNKLESPSMEKEHEFA
jgi:hypothetical protein